MRSNPKLTADEWGRQNRVYGKETGHPGPRNPDLTPYTKPWIRVADSGEFRGRIYDQAIITMFAQGGKTDGMLDLIGSKLDQRPAPILYVGPSKEFNTGQFEPRIIELFSQAPGLSAKVDSGRSNKIIKRVAGVRLRLAHAGSSTALKSDPASLALVDEYDEMLANVKGQGDPYGLVMARGDTYADFRVALASTPSRGAVDVEHDDKSGLTFWKKAPPEDMESGTWKLFQQGTMHHWSWPCPHCGTYFVPRFRNLRWPKDATAAIAKRTAWIECPKCSQPIENKHKAEMNARGLAVAPGEWIENGVVVGEPPDTTIFSLWVSGLCSPFKTFGERAARFLQAEESGDPDKLQTAYNSQFGELYAPGGGEIPEWKDILQLRMPYEPKALPTGVILITVAIDVQATGLFYIVRGWGARSTSWLIEYGKMWGSTVDPKVWTDATDLIYSRYGNMPIKVGFIDSGFRPGKPSVIPENKVYEFCRQHQRFIFPTKGRDTLRTPIVKSRLEVTMQGSPNKYGLDLYHLNSDYWKMWVHERLRWPKDQPGAFYLHEQADEDYAKQLVSEARLKTPSGKPTWVRRSRENHYLDCEAIGAAAGYLLGVQRIGVKAKREGEPPAPAATPAPTGAPASDSSTASRFAKWADRFQQR